MAQLLALRFRLIESLIARLSLQGRMLGVITCVCVALVGTEAWQLQRVYDANIQQTEVVTSNTARSMAEQVETTIKTADTIVASLVGRVEAEGTGPEARARLYGLMTSLATALPAIHKMGISDSQGNAIVNSLTANPGGLNYGERTYFHYHATHPERGAFIGARIKSKIDGSNNITVTRRINHADRSFAGVVVTSVSLAFFQRLFDQMQAKSGGVIALLADDDTTTLARSPFVASGADGPAVSSELRRQMRNPRAGSLTYTSGIDGVPRLGSYQHLSEFPLTLLVSQSAWDVQRGWRSELRWHAIILAIVVIVVIVLGGRAVEANRVLNTLATHDGLTGLANRRYLDATIEREFRRAARSRQPLSIVMIDIDHFKGYNDCYGHPAGDDCLCSVAGAIQGCLRRAGDLAGRYGGEEFIAVLPGSDAPRALAFAERMRLTVRGLALQHGRSERGIVTLSAGVATFVPGRSAGSWQVLLGDADAALYAAKASGRDRVQIYAPPQPVISPASRARAGGLQAA
jgi:diguanylate cyclase (GGDEF)-like protein